MGMEAQLTGWKVANLVTLYRRLIDPVGEALALGALSIVARRDRTGDIVAIDRTSKFAFVELLEKVARRTAGDFLRRLIAAVPYKVHTVLTDNGTHFTTPGNTSSAAPDIKAALEAGELVWAHAFEYACAQNEIDHRLTKPKHPWTNGQVERMNRTIKDATVKRYFCANPLRDFVDAYNFARRLKTLRGLTPYEFICKAWTSQPQRFKLSPLQQMPGLNTGQIFRDSGTTGERRQTWGWRRE